MSWPVPRTVLTSYAVAWLYLAGFIAVQVAYAALSPHDQAAVLGWASTNVHNLRHHPVGSLVASAFRRDALARIRAKKAQHFALAFGDAHDILAGAQFAPLERKRERAEAHDGSLGLAEGRSPGAAEHGADPPAGARAARTVSTGSRRRRSRGQGPGPAARRAPLASGSAPGSRFRKCAANSKPFSPGIVITSSTMMSKARPSRKTRASAAVAATVTRWPFFVR